MNTIEVRERLVQNMNAFNVEGPQAVERIPDLYAEDVVFQDPIQTVHGLAPFLETNRRMMGRAKALEVEIADVFEAGDQIFCSWKMRYVPKMGPAIAIDGCTHCRVRDGKIVYHRDYWDLLGSVVESLPVVAPVYKMLVKKLG
jgi:ketosteroid isomerase-like protein